jgi:hypothetical protein
MGVNHDASKCGGSSTDSTTSDTEVFIVCNDHSTILSRRDKTASERDN